MRTVWLAALLAILTLSGAAQAQQPVDPYGTADVAGPATEPAQPINPYAAPAPTYQYPQYPTAPPQQQPYYAPPASTCCCNPCQNYYPYTYQYPRYQLRQAVVRRAPYKWDGVRRFSLGVHGTAMWINQSVGGSQVVLGGAGLQMRIRTKGRFGIELNQSFLHWSKNAFSRDSFPFTFSLMMYVFPNQDTRHFNIYGLAGFGAMLDTIHLRGPQDNIVEQDFLEWIGHVGAGAELRFKWWAIEADARFFGTARDNSSTPAAYYRGVDGGPVANNNWGISGNVYLSLWF